MNRAAIARAQAYFDGGGFVSDLRRRVALPSSSQEPGRAEALRTYLRDKVASAAPFWLRKLRLSLGPACPGGGALLSQNKAGHGRQSGRANSSGAWSSVRPMSAIMCGPTSRRRRSSLRKCRRARHAVSAARAGPCLTSRRTLLNSRSHCFLDSGGGEIGIKFLGEL